MVGLGRKLFSELEFYVKVCLCCTVFALFFEWLLPAKSVLYQSLFLQTCVYWFVSSSTFWTFGLCIEVLLKQHYPQLAQQWSVRTKKLPPQPLPLYSGLMPLLIGEAKGFFTCFLILYFFPEQPLRSSSSALAHFFWFFLHFAVSDFAFYWAHRALHTFPFLRSIHKAHHDYATSSSFVAGHKSLAEYCITTTTDLLATFFLGRSLCQLLAWTAVGNAYNLEGHSGLSIFFVHSDFHDLHHSNYSKNYGVQGLWDIVFGTLNEPTLKPGFRFSLVSPAAKQ